MRLKEWLVKEFIPYMAGATALFLFFGYPYPWLVVAILGVMWVAVLLVLAFGPDVDLWEGDKK